MKLLRVLLLKSESIIPMLSKIDVMNNLYMDLFSVDHNKKDMHKIATSGSTGQPFVTYADRKQLEVRFATTLRSLEWTGWRFGDRQLRLWHQKLGMSWGQVFKERFDAVLLRRKFIPAFELTEESLGKLSLTLNRFKPKLIDGYAESLNFLSIYLKNGGHLSFKPKGVMSSAQMLTSHTRNEIEKSLDTKVFDKYGAREFSGIAYQCEFSQDHHVMDESYIVEILVQGRPAKPGETGEVVITDLNNYSVPLIRYRIGDLAMAVDNNIPCECGRGLSRIGEIQGRTQALIYCANGRWLPGTFFAHFFKDYDNIISLFQVVQEEKNGFILRIVKGNHWNSSDWDELIDHLRKYVGETLIKVDFVQSIPLLKTGKRTPVISYLKNDFQNIDLKYNS
jgi:phenylacetate-CoA ligase